MPSTDWHILRVETGRELHVHELLTHNDVGAEVWTPFETRFQTLRKKHNNGLQKRIPYAEPLFRGYLIFRVPNSKAAQAVLSHVESRSYIYGLMTDGERLIAIDEHSRALYEYDLTHHHGKLVIGRGFDPKQDARKNQKRVYAKSQVVPTFKEGETVTFMEGPFMGLSGRVVPISEREVRVFSKDLGALDGMKVSPFALRKAG